MISSIKEQLNKSMRKITKLNCPEISLVLFPGPNHWCKAFPHAAGKMQSPVDIRSSMVNQDPQLLQRSLSWTYVPKNCKSMLNTGESWKVIVEGQDSCEFNSNIPILLDYLIQQTLILILTILILTYYSSILRIYISSPP